MQVILKQKSDVQGYMASALSLARKAKGQTSPNPVVGALVVKQGKIIARGYHHKAGGAHAEVNALRQAGKLSQGAELYVTLEPCSSYGKTPPCTQAIIKAGIKKVYIACLDPNPLNRGRGVSILKKNNIQTNVGILKAEAQKLNEDFQKFINKKMPFVTLKVAQTLDGKMAAKNGSSKWITSKASRKRVHQMRSENTALLTGIATVLKDDPQMTARLYSKRKNINPYRVLLDSKLQVPLSSHILKNNCPGVIIFTTCASNKEKYKRLSKRQHIRIVQVRKTKDGLSLREVLKKLADLKIMSLMVEAGPRLASSFIKQRLADKLIFFIAPKLLADKNALSLDSGPKKNINEALTFKRVSYEIIDKDIMLEAYI
jgi:diaminohydroxyphosphoribosylaminopyrimidine deaminase/5-amino-6-(5-phosphoribosylamino)uracil reductase